MMPTMGKRMRQSNITDLTYSDLSDRESRFVWGGRWGEWDRFSLLSLLCNN